MNGLKKILKDYSKFVCISAGKINFLIPSDQVVTSVYCSGGNYFRDGKFIYENQKIPFMDFYNDNSSVEYFGDVIYTETAIVIKNTSLFDDTKYFSLITSKKCVVLDVAFKDFSLFSRIFEDNFRKIGFRACYFVGDAIYYLVDIEVFLKNFLI